MTQFRTVIVLAAGGTGGHMFPAEALARELAARHFALALVTDKRGAAFGDNEDVDVHRIHAGQMVGGTIRKMLGAAQMARGLFEARRVHPNELGNVPSVPGFRHLSPVFVIDYL